MVRIIIKIIDKIFSVLNRMTNILYTYNFRPKFSKDFSKASDNFDYSKLGVIIQGNLINPDFLIETVKIYRDKIFPGSKIIVSTWSDEPTIILDKLKSLKPSIKVIISNKPKNCGIANINYQILSTSEAVLWAKKKFKYLLKTRSDQRIYALNTFQFFLSILKSFPSKSKKQKNRLIGVSLNTFSDRMYGISDMLMFGHTEDMVKYWTPPLDERKITKNFNKYIPFRNQLEYSKARICEVYLAAKYIELLGHSLKWTISDSKKVYKNFFCIVDKSSIDLFWNKYTRREEPFNGYGRKFNEIKFKDWINIYNN